MSDSALGNTLSYLFIYKLFICSSSERSSFMSLFSAKSCSVSNWKLVLLARYLKIFSKSLALNLFALNYFKTH